MNRMNNIPGLPAFAANKPYPGGSRVESLANSHKSSLEQHYGDDWTDADKALFDAMVKEEMLKVERGIKSQMSLESNSPRNYEASDNASVASHSSKQSYGRRDVSARDENVEVNVRHQQQQKYSQQLNQDARRSDVPVSMSKSDRYYASMEGKENSEQSFTSKLGEYENSNRDNRRVKQQEYARQLNQQVSATEVVTDRDVIGRATSRTRTRANTLNYSDNSQGTGLAIGLDPNQHRAQEKLKKQEYARMLGQQVEYQSSGVSADNSGRSRGYSDPVKKLYGPVDVSPISPVRKQYGNEMPSYTSRSNDQPVGLQVIGQFADNEKRRKKEKQQEYYNQLASDINHRPQSDSLLAGERRPSVGRSARSQGNEEELPGGGFLSIGERSSVGRYPSRNGKSVEDQESMDKRRSAQQDYFKLLEQDKLRFGNIAKSDISSPPQQRNRSYESETGLAIGRDPSLGSSDRKQKQFEYRKALESDAARRGPADLDYSSRDQAVNSGGYESDSYDSQSRQYHDRDVDEARGYNEQISQKKSNPYEFDRQTGFGSNRNAPPARIDLTSIQRSQPTIPQPSSKPIGGKSSMAEIMGGADASPKYIPGLGLKPNPQPYERMGGYAAPERSGYVPSQQKPRSDSNFRTRGTSTGGGASSFTLG